MICNSCGATIPEDSVFCENCGAPLEPVETPEEDLAEEAEPEMAEEAEKEMAEEAEKESVEETEDDFKEIEELEAMEEVEFPEVDIPEEAQLPDLNELDFEQTGQPEGSETEWLESFQQLSPKEEDWPEEPAEEEVPIEDLEEEFEEAEEVEEEVPIEDLEEDLEEEAVEEEVVEEADESEEAEETEEAEEEVPFEDLEEDLEEAEEEAVEEEAVEEADESEETEETEEAEEEVPIEDLEEDLEEAEEEAVEEEAVEEAEETEEEPVEEETGTEEPEDEPTEEKKAISEGAEKVNSWLGNLGKSVRTGTGWAVDIAKDKASNTKKRSEKKGERDQWSKEEEGDLDLGYDFWYKSNQADTSSRYAGMEEEEEENKIDDATTYVAVKRNQTEMDEESEGAEQKKKKPANKLKITVIILLIAALVGAGGIFGSKTYTENKEQEAYQASLTKAEKLVEKKDYESAEKIYQDLLAEYPDRAELYENLAALYMNEEKFDDAKNTINEGIARTGKSKAYAALSEDLDALTSTEWREPFRRVLADNEWAVKRYDDINGSCVALCDITGDKRPEMMFFTQEYFGYGKLHVVVYDDEKAKELSYDCKNRSTQYQDAFYDIENDESGYIIYKSKKAGKFGIFASFKHGGIDEWSTINRYTLSGTSLDRDSVFEACITTSYRVSEDDEDDGNTKYYKGENEKEIKYGSYIKEFNAVLNDIDQVIMTSENTAGDKEIWNRIMDIDEAAMTYSEAMKILDEDAI